MSSISQPVKVQKSEYFSLNSVTTNILLKAGKNEIWVNTKSFLRGIENASKFWFTVTAFPGELGKRWHLQLGWKPATSCWKMESTKKTTAKDSAH